VEAEAEEAEGHKLPPKKKRRYRRGHVRWRLIVYAKGAGRASMSLPTTRAPTATA